MALLAQTQLKLKIFVGMEESKGAMATRSSARLAALSPPPQLPTPTSTAMPNSFSTSPRPPISTIEWTQTQLDEYNVHIQETSDMTRLFPADYTEHKSLGITLLYRGWCIDSANIPDLLFSDGSDVSGDFLIRAFFDTLRMIQAMVIDTQRESILGLEGYTRQLLSDFVRIVFWANNAVLGNARLGEVQIKYVCYRNELIFLVLRVEWLLILLG
jgi:hypothetical protein